MENSENNNEKNLEAQQEIRHLKNTITVLHREMDQIHHESDQRVSEAVREAGKEIAQLKTVAQALREEIDNLMLEKE